MPWYWTDDVAKVLVAEGAVSERIAASLVVVPVAFRSDKDSISEVARDLLDDGEIPLAA